MDDYLALGALIIARLKDLDLGIPPANVISARDLTGVQEKAQLTPAVQVYYWGDLLGAEAATKQGRLITQQWITVVQVKNARDQRSGEAARADAGPLAQSVITGLQGWRPGPGYGPMSRFAAPRPLYSPGGFLYVPLGWQSQISTQGNPSQ